MPFVKKYVFHYKSTMFCIFPYLKIGVTSNLDRSDLRNPGWVSVTNRPYYYETSNIIAGRPKAALLFLFFSEFRYGVLLFIRVQRYAKKCIAIYCNMENLYCDINCDTSSICISLYYCP